jgi:hypothetical protein
MMDFTNGSFIKLSAVDVSEVGAGVSDLLVPGEQGITGKKKDFTSLPYSKIQAFSVETAGTFDLDAELDLWFSSLGKVHLEFKGNADIRRLAQLIAGYVL